MTNYAVWIAGALGLSLVTRAALIYRGVDRVAFGLVSLIGALFALGIVELLLRARRTAKLDAEIRALPAEASESVVAACSPEVQTALRARIAGVPTPAAPTLFASHLLGLLVMIGLLGTFLGLFETLRGAREALTASTDVAALRVGLAAPMQGLSRAFGASAAGVSASATLGIAFLFVRRADARLARAFAAYAAGPLAPITIAGRTLAALEALAAHGRDLPGAALAMREAAASVREDLAKSARETSEATSAAIERAITPRIDAATAALAANVEELPKAALAMREAAASVREDLAKSARDTAEATAATLERALAPRLDAAVQRAGDAVDAHVERWTAHDDARAAATRDVLLEAHRAELALVRASVAGDAARILEGLAREGESQRGAIDRSMASVGERLAASETALGERVGIIGRELDGYVARLQGLQGEARAESEAHAAKLSAELEAHLRGLAESVASSLDAVVQSSKAAPEAAARVIDVASGALSQRAERDREHDERLAKLADALSFLVDAVSAHASASEARVAALEEKLATTYASSTEAWTQRLGAHADALEDQVSTNLAAVREAADVLRGGGDELAAVAQLFGGAVDRYREASDRWLTGLTALRTAAEQAAKGDAHDLLGAYLDQTREVFDHSMQFQRQLFTELRQLAAAKGS